MLAPAAKFKAEDVSGINGFPPCGLRSHQSALPVASMQMLSRLLVGFEWLKIFGYSCL